MEFDKQFVHCVWDESLVGKLCVFADDMPDLKTHVERHDPHYTAILQEPCPNVDMDTLAYPFYKDANANAFTGYRFVYYDPNLECKIAFEQGKQIQFKSFEGDWVDVEKPVWSERDVYRVKPEPKPMFDVVESEGKYQKRPYSGRTSYFSGTEAECDAWIVEHTPKRRRMTNKELAKWLAEGNGQKIESSSKHHYCTYAYNNGDDLPCRDSVKIRAWNEEYWHEPLVEVNNGHN